MMRQNNQRALYAVKQYIKYYKKTDEGLIVGRGVIPRLNRHFSQDIDDITIDLSTASIKNKDFKCNATLRDYQEGVTDVILPHTEGIIRLDTAFGKSVISLKLIEETQLKTLIIVPRLNLLRQFKSDIKKFCNYECGIINGPIFDIKDVTVATIQTLKQRNLKEVKDKFGMVIADECHLYVGDKSNKVITSFNPLRLYGMTGTADRSDGQGEAIKFMFGDIIVDRKLPSKSPHVEIIKSQTEVWGDTYATIIDSQVENTARNDLIVNTILKECLNDRRIIVLTKRTIHCDKLYDLLPGTIKAYKIKSKLKAKEAREQDALLEKFREGGKDFQVIIGTFGLLSTGINIPALDTLIFAGDIKSSVLSVQSIGRIRRIFQGKKDPKIIDIDDCKSGILHHQALLRKQFYKSNEWEII